MNLYCRFPETEFFRDPATQKMLTDILFVWSKENKDLSYRQGMHELLALILFVVNADKFKEAPDADNEAE